MNSPRDQDFHRSSIMDFMKGFQIPDIFTIGRKGKIIDTSL